MSERENKGKKEIKVIVEDRRLIEEDSDREIKEAGRQIGEPQAPERVPPEQVSEAGRVGGEQELAPSDRLSGEEHEEGEEPELLLSIDNILRSTIIYAISLTWQYLGLRADPQTGKVSRDLRLAKVSIDTVESCFNLAGEFMGQEERREIERVLKDLKTNFVQASRP